MDDLESRSRRNSLIIKGIKGEPRESVDELMIIVNDALSGMRLNSSLVGLLFRFYATLYSTPNLFSNV